MSKLGDKEKIKNHALAQEKYTRKKMQTHKRMGIWVPKKHVTKFLKIVEELEKTTWSK